MSMLYCEFCDVYVDTDFDDTHTLCDNNLFVCVNSQDPEPAGDFSGASFDEWGGR